MTEQEYWADVEELSLIFGGDDDERINLLADRIEAYEDEHYPIGSVSGGE